MLTPRKIVDVVLFGMDLDHIEQMAVTKTPRVLPIVIHPIVNVGPKKAFTMDMQ